MQRKTSLFMAHRRAPCSVLELIARILAERLPVPAALGVFSGDADLARAGDSAQLFPFKMGNLELGAVMAAYAGPTSLRRSRHFSSLRES